MRAIVNLERGVQNIPVLTRLQPKLSELKRRAGFKLLSDQEHKTDYGYEPSLTVKYINSWVKAKNCVVPTWKNFLQILKDISPELSKLSDQIEHYIAGKGRVSHQAGGSHVIKHGHNTANLIENVTVGNQVNYNGKRAISANADDEQNMPRLRRNREDSRNHHELKETMFQDQTYNSQSRDRFPVSDESDQGRFDNRDDRRDQKNHQVDRKPDSTNNQNSLLFDETLDDMKDEKKQKDQPIASSDYITSHGLTSYSYKPGMHHQLQSISKLAPEWMQEPDNKLSPADGQIDSKHHLQGMTLSMCKFMRNYFFYICLEDSQRFTDQYASNGGFT